VVFLSPVAVGWLAGWLAWDRTAFSRSDCIPAFYSPSHSLRGGGGGRVWLALGCGQQLK